MLAGRDWLADSLRRLHLRAAEKLANASDGKDHIETLWARSYVVRGQGRVEATLIPA